jgi:AmmeMemoRadiSam system protein B
MSEISVRQPAVDGQFYPGDPDVLRRSVVEYLNNATLPGELGNIRAVIAPHAGYMYSGPTAGFAFKALATVPEKHWTVFLLGPAHRMPFYGVALGDFAAFKTPLGDAAVATDRIEEMLSRSLLYTRAPMAHVPEHCLEVEVPFLQETLPDFTLVPMLFGEVDPHDVGQELSPHIGPDDLIVISSDLSHYYSYDQARQLDSSILDAVMAGDMASVLHGEACGRAPVVTLMTIARNKGWMPHLLDYRTSGDTAGDKGQVVGYGAIAYTE